MVPETTAILQLPLSVIGKVDLGRLLREVDALESYLEGAAVRDPGGTPKLPKTSRLMDDTLLQNRLDPLTKADRSRLRDFLEGVREEAPLLHMSFSADPTPLFTQKLIAWLRQEIHPVVLLQIGLQPTIGAGCIVRTTNKQFDFSLRARLKERREILINKIHEITQQALAQPVLVSAAVEQSATVAQVPIDAPVPAVETEPIRPVVPIAPVEADS